MVKINGEQMDLAGQTVAHYLETAGYNLQRVAVERNGDIVPKRVYAETLFQDGDQVEIVGFVGGG